MRKVTAMKKLPQKVRFKMKSNDFEGKVNGKSTEKKGKKIPIKIQTLHRGKKVSA